MLEHNRRYAARITALLVLAIAILYGSALGLALTLHELTSHPPGA